MSHDMFEMHNEDLDTLYKHHFDLMDKTDDMIIHFRGKLCN